MAECLILAFEPGATGDNAWRLGHVIDIKPDGQVWGSQEGLPKFWILTVSGATVADCQAYIAQVTAAQPDGTEKVTKIRDMKLDYAMLPTPVKNTLANTGRYTVTKAQADGYIKKVT